MDLVRTRLKHRLELSLKRNPIVSLIGPRQCGKTTLAREVASEQASVFFDLENPVDARRLENPMTALEPLSGLVVIDEAQRQLNLAPVLRVLADRKPNAATFLLLGSASPELIKGVSETLAGRVSFVEMAGFSLGEVGPDRLKTLWLRGGFPRSFLAEASGESFSWRQDFIRTFLEMDLRQYGVQVAPVALRRLWNMLAHYHGQVGNASEIGRSLGEAYSTIKRHVDILSGALVVRQLQPWHENISKRQVKSPKLYIRDSGILHALLGIESWADLESHPKLGASWEGFCIETILSHAGERNSWFWGTHGQAELDLLVIQQGRRIGFEFKYADAPGTTRSMHIAHDDLHLEKLYVVYPGSGGSYPLNEWAEVIAIKDLENRLDGIFPFKAN